MPRALDGQTKVEVGQHAVICRRCGRKKLDHVVAENRRLDARPAHVDQRPVERRVADAKPQPDGAVAGDADVCVDAGTGHRGAARVERAPLADTDCRRDVIASCCCRTKRQSCTCRQRYSVDVV